MVPTSTAHGALLILVLLALALASMVVRPFATALFLAAVVAGTLHPLMNRLSRWLRGRRRLAALLLTVAVLLAILGPLSGLGAALIPQIENGVRWLREAVQNDTFTRWVAKVPEAVRPWAERALETIPSSLARLQEMAATQGSKALPVFANVLSATGTFLFQSVMVLIALYFLLLDGPRFAAWLVDAMPLKRGQTAEFLREFRRVTAAVLISTLVTGGIQALLAFGAYLVTSVPNALFFAFVTFIFALIPALGAAVVVVAIGVVVLVTGSLVKGIFLIAFGVGVVGLVDNVVKPLLIKGDIAIHGAVIFFALLGGLSVFGPIGILIGPLTITFLVVVLRMYRRDYGS